MSAPVAPPTPPAPRLLFNPLSIDPFPHPTSSAVVRIKKCESANLLVCICDTTNNVLTYEQPQLYTLFTLFARNYNTISSPFTKQTIRLAMSANVLGQKDVNAPMEQQPVNGGKDVKSMDYHRQMLQSKIQEPYDS